MPTAEALAMFGAAALLVVVVPGPSVLFAVTRTVEHGRRAGVWSVLGLETGMLVHVVLAAVSIGVAWLSVSSLRRRRVPAAG